MKNLLALDLMAYYRQGNTMMQAAARVEAEYQEFCESRGREFDEQVVSDAFRVFLKDLAKENAR